MDKETSKSWERPWTTDEIREHSPNWNLAGDSGLLNHLQQFSQNLLAQTHATEVALDKLVEDLETTSTSVHNATNTFLFLANTQFVENRVYDDDEKETPPDEKKSDVKTSKTKEEEEAEVFQNVKQALDMGLALLDTHFEAVEVPASDSEEEESSASMGRLVLKPKNPYLSRPLPYLIGSREFMEDDKVGLGDISSDTEESPDQNIVQSSESDDEMEHDELIVTPKRRLTLSSSDTENSEPESDRSETVFEPKKLRTSSLVKTLGEEKDEDGEDMFGQESPPEVDVAVVKRDLKNAFSDELSSKLGSSKPHKVPEREKDEDNMFEPSSEPEDDSGLFGKAGHSFSEKQGLFDDLDDWQNTSNSLWKNNISSNKPVTGLSNEKADKTGNFSNSSYDNKEDGDKFSTTKSKMNATLNVPDNTKIFTSTPEVDMVHKPEKDGLFDQKDESEDLFAKGNKDSMTTRSGSALFNNDDLQEDDLFAVPSQPSTSQNSKRKELAGAVPVLVDVNLFGNISPLVPSDSSAGNDAVRRTVQSSGNSLQQEATASSGIGSSVYSISKKDSKTVSGQQDDNTASGKSFHSDVHYDQLFQSALTSTKVDKVSSKSSLFKEENDSDSLFDKMRHSEQNVSVHNRNISGPKLPTSSSLKTKKKSFSLFDDSDSGDDELLFSSTSSTSSRSRRSQGSGDILAGAVEKRMLPKKGLFEDNGLFGSGNNNEPEVDIFNSLGETKPKVDSLSKDNILGNDVADDSSTRVKKITSNIFDDIDDVDDIFAVPKIAAEETHGHSSVPNNSGSYSLFPDKTYDKNGIFSGKIQENRGNEEYHSVLEEPCQNNSGALSVADIATVPFSGDVSSLLTKDSSLNTSDTKIKEKVTQNTKPVISRKPKVPMKPMPSSSTFQSNSQVSHIPKVDSEAENNQSLDVRGMETYDISISADNCGSKSDSVSEVEKFTSNQVSPVSSAKPKPPQTLNIRRTTDIVFETPSNGDDDLFESSWSEKTSVEKGSNHVSHHQVSHDGALSSSNFSKLLEGFSSTTLVTTSSNMPKEGSSSSSSVSSRTLATAEVSDMPVTTATEVRHTFSPTKIHIDPRTLLPGAKPPSRAVTANRAVDFDKPAEIASMLHSAGKERVKIQVKRRPQTRRARQEALRASSIEYDSIDAALISQLSSNKNDSVHTISSSASSNSPSNSVTPKVFEPDRANKSPVLEKYTNDVCERSFKNNSEGQSSIPESDQLGIKTDTFKLMLSDGLSGNSNPLSPLTDEEDLFAVPHELTFDETNSKEVSNDSKNMFGGAPVLSPLELKTENGDFSNQSVTQTCEEQNTFLPSKKEISSDTMLGDTLKNNDTFQEGALTSDISRRHTAPGKSSYDSITSVSNTEDMFAKPLDTKWLDPGHLESPLRSRGLFDEGYGDQNDNFNDDDDDSDLFSTVKNLRKKGEKGNFSGVVPQTSLFSPDASSDLENIIKENTQVNQSSEEFYSGAKTSPSKLLVQKDSETKSDLPTASKNISSEQGNSDDSSVHFPKGMVESSPKQKIDDLFSSNISVKDTKSASSVKTTDKTKSNSQQEKVKSHLDSLFGDDSTESDDLFGSSSVPKKTVAGLSSNSALGSKLRETKDSLFDDADDDIFTLGLSKNKGPKSEIVFARDENPTEIAEGSDDLFSKKNTNSRNQATKPSSAQKVESFEDPLMVFNK